MYDKWLVYYLVMKLWNGLKSKQNVVFRMENEKNINYIDLLFTYCVPNRIKNFLCN